MRVPLRLKSVHDVTQRSGPSSFPLPPPQVFLGDFLERGRIGEHENKQEARAEAGGKEKIHEQGLIGRLFFPSIPCARSLVFKVASYSLGLLFCNGVVEPFCIT